MELNGRPRRSVAGVSFQPSIRRLAAGRSSSVKLKVKDKLSGLTEGDLIKPD